MPSRIFKFIWKLHPIALGLLMVFIIFFFFALNVIVGIFSFFANTPEPGDRIMIIGPFLIYAIYLIWSRNVAVFFNQKLVKPSPIPITWYMRSYWYLIIYVFLETITKTPLGDTDLKVSETTYLVLLLVAMFIRFLALIAFIYTNLFTAQVVMSIEKGKRVAMSDSLLYAGYMWAFPIGIPMLQHKLKKKSKKKITPNR